MAENMQEILARSMLSSKNLSYAIYRKENDGLAIFIDMEASRTLKIHHQILTKKWARPIYKNKLFFAQ